LKAHNDHGKSFKQERKVKTKYPEVLSLVKNKVVIFEQPFLTTIMTTSFSSLFIGKKQRR